MVRIAVLVGAVLCIVTTACSSGGHSSAAPTTTSTLVGGLSAASARARCRSALPGRVLLNWSVLAPGALVAMRTAQDAQAERMTTTLPTDNEIAVWCWTGRPNDYKGYAIGSRGEVLAQQELLEEYRSTPPPGPAPIP